MRVEHVALQGHAESELLAAHVANVASGRFGLTSIGIFVSYQMCGNLPFGWISFATQIADVVLLILVVDFQVSIQQQLGIESFRTVWTVVEDDLVVVALVSSQRRWRRISGLANITFQHRIIGMKFLSVFEQLL